MNIFDSYKIDIWKLFAHSFFIMKLFYYAHSLQVNKAFFLHNITDL